MRLVSLPAIIVLCDSTSLKTKQSWLSHESETEHSKFTTVLFREAKKQMLPLSIIIGLGVISDSHDAQFIKTSRPSVVFNAAQTQLSTEEF